MIGSIMDHTQKFHNDWRPSSFLEISKYFDSADVTFLRFNVEPENTTHRTPNEHDRQGNVLVDLPRMEAFVLKALQEVESEHEWRSFAGW